MHILKKNLSAWGGSISSSSYYAEVQNTQECREVLEFSRRKTLSIAPRGNGCSHADSCQNNDNIVLDTSNFNNIIAFDDKAGVLTVEPGVSFSKVLRFAMPLGWVIPCAPGSLDVTMAGAMSFDVHGKDGIKNGSFGDHILSFKLLNADGYIEEIDEKTNKILFDLAIGGMGLFGLIVEIRVQLMKVPSSLLEVKKITTKNVFESLTILDEQEQSGFYYGIGWMDTFAPGEAVGRGFMTTAKWSSKPYDLSLKKADEIFQTNTKILGFIESLHFWKIVKPAFNPFFIRWVNLAHYTLGKILYAQGHTKEKLFADYIYIHNLFPNINQVYQPKGLVTCQPLIPREAGHKSFKKLLSLCQDEDIASMMAGVKRRRANARPVSFADDGYSFSIDIQKKRFSDRTLNKKLNIIYETIIDLGGRIYLAKDDRLPSNHFKSMYPKWEEFWDMKEKLDPNMRFLTDQSRRLFNVK